jgi:putative ABC transport system ATP-binding protein
VKDIIELREVSKLYGFGDATTVAVEDVSLCVKQGEFLAVMGPSGSGKSTLMNLIGLLDRPTQGAYLLNGRAVVKFGQRRCAKLRRDNFGFVFQSFNLLPQLTALENVALPLAYRGKTRFRRLKQAGNALERVGLADREYFYPKQLSGGQLQRVAVARAIVNNPDIIIADEPTGNLDSGSSRVVMELLADLHKSGHTILMVTHNPELTRYASRVVFMHDGTIIADEASVIGDVAEIAKKMYFRSRTTEEDDLAGISAIMQAIPQADRLIKKTRKKVSKKPKPKPRKPRATTKQKTAKKNKVAVK